MDRKLKTSPELKAFTEPIVVRGKTYWDQFSYLYSLLRFPSPIPHLYPQLRKQKTPFEIQCFPTRGELRKYLDKSSNVPLIVNLFDETGKDLLDETSTFSEAITLSGITYLHSYSGIYNLLRFPAEICRLFPKIFKRKIHYEIHCFPSREELQKYLDKNSSSMPLIINLFEREEENNSSSLPQK